MPDVRRRGLFGVVLVVVVLTAVLLALGLGAEREQSRSSALPPEPLLPTRTIPALNTAVAPLGTATAEPRPAAAVPRAATAAAVRRTEPAPDLGEPPVLPASELARYGVAGSPGLARRAAAAGLPFGSLLNWSIVADPPNPGPNFWQMVRLEEEGIRRMTWEDIEAVAAANPGSFWLIGNEPDVKWQDNVTPGRYAEHYHDLYTFIKARDPLAKIVIGGVSQPTPLRRAYLDLVLAAYEDKYGEPMPVDVWNVHAFTLREEAGSWGVDIPPGMEGAEGTLYEIEDHDNLAILQQNLFDFRAWMAERGYGSRPLVISEYGILMPEDYGFPPERVAAFLTGTFDIFRTAANETGYSPDGGRLVQWWFWYSLYDSELYPTGNLWDDEARLLTTLGQAWTEYVNTAAAP